MPQLIERDGGVQEEPQRVSGFKMHLNSIFASGKKLWAIQPDCVLERVEAAVVRLEFPGGKSYDFLLEDSPAADQLEAGIRSIISKRALQGRVGAQVPAGLGRAAPLRAEGGRGPGPRGAAPDEFGGFTLGNTLPKSGVLGRGAKLAEQRTPEKVMPGRKEEEAATRARWHEEKKFSMAPPEAVSMAPPEVNNHDAKRRKIDMACGASFGTPDRQGYAGIGGTSGPIRRAPPPSSGLLSGSGRFSTPQSSSAYAGYRSSETFGLRNLGNTCYLNAVMQALRSLWEFTTDLKAMADVVPACARGELFRCTVDIIEQMSSKGAQGAASPAKLREHIAIASPMFGSNEQQDAHEFLLEYVNQLHDELLGARGQWLAEQATPPKDGVGALATQAHLDSEVQKRITCIQCKETRDKRERFRDFSLDFGGPEGADSCSLMGMVKAYFQDELLDVQCEKCQAAAGRMEKFLASPPRTLVLHMKRFVPNLEMRRYDKCQRSVDIPATLDLGSCDAGASPSKEPLAPSPRLPARPLAGEAGDRSPELGGKAAAKPGTAGPRYSLRSVISHEGPSPHSGHYTCYAKGEKGGWWLYNDSTVREVSPAVHRELGRKAYILLYVLDEGDAAKDAAKAGA